MSDERLELVRRFANTFDVETQEDAVATPAALGAWLAEHALPGSEAVTAADVRRAAVLRDALRAHLAANAGEPVDPGAVKVLEAQARRSRIELSFDPAGSALVPRVGGVDGALGRILVAVAAAMADGSWSRLKVCRADDCRWAFLDRSRNGSRHWCDMRVCGNRQKARSFRARQRA